MKTAMMDETTSVGKNLTRLPREVRAATRRPEKERKAIGADPQVAEFERTFSVRWEW
jgi:hypothetical protein